MMKTTDRIAEIKKQIEQYTLSMNLALKQADGYRKEAKKFLGRNRDYALHYVGVFMSDARELGDRILMLQDELEVLESEAVPA